MSEKREEKRRHTEPLVIFHREGPEKQKQTQSVLKGMATLSSSTRQRTAALQMSPLETAFDTCSHFSNNLIGPL